MDKEIYGFEIKCDCKDSINDLEKFISLLKELKELIDAIDFNKLKLLKNEINK